MRNYELVVIFDPALKEVKKEIEKVEKLLEELGGKNFSRKDWGNLELGYPIKKIRQGLYYLYLVELPEEAAAVLRGKLKLNEAVLRYLLCRAEPAKKNKEKNKKII